MAEVWFRIDEATCPADVVRYVQVPNPIEVAHCEPFHTLVVSLARDEGEIFQRMEPGTRYEIRRAQSRDGLRYDFSSIRKLEDMSDFVAAYNQHVLRQNSVLSLSPVRLAGMARAGVLDLSTTRTSDGGVLTWHVHVVTAGVARLLLSASAFSNSLDQQLRALCGRANRLHHWLDMLRFRDSRCASYDFGGYYDGSTDEKKLHINRFKKGFGGEVMSAYNCLYGRTAIGRLALAGRRILRGHSRP